MDMKQIQQKQIEFIKKYAPAYRQFVNAYVSGIKNDEVSKKVVESFMIHKYQAELIKKYSGESDEK